MNKVLIVEDEMSIAELEKDYLELSGFDVTISMDGEQANRAIKHQSYDLIILDIMLPGTDGWELCEQLRRTLDIPILMVTARKEDIDKIKGFNRGADDYIVKPFNPNELLARVKAHIARYRRLTNREGTHQLIEIGSVTIDPQSRQVSVNEQILTLTAKEYDLLYFLACHPNHVFTKEQLLERIWGFDAIGDSSTVTVHIRKIREKIEKNPSKLRLIETIWGVGYRLKK
ncbi:response regulator transcription factor [Gracilibacillus caseinilyticus]|uniref:Response regulator transcription factor n=1 Tax=Gracilibacillus caseinilyticus TaxID=2932256 RepID=A0ABY4EWA1_9BACI|nr:response regulator transcription factor [Gracilibacillus caseinilyticus]UOQ48559.1 response regulator transcription factor [Gracilibacillus caseinilyticus]